MSELILDSVSHSYERRQTLNGVSFTLEEGKIGCLMGPSGCGKTTVLLCIAGLERLAGGSVRLGGALISGEGSHTPPEKRKVGMVFQDFALFPHLSAANNVMFGLRRLSIAAARQRVDEMLELCGLRDLRDTYPHELSGGEQQRVALARALATKPDLLLLDEPFSRLDAALHEKLSRQVRDILKSRRQTALFVTHNQNEAFLIADIGGVINEGAICQWGEMDNLYHNPRCTFVAGFVGDGVLLDGVMRSDGAVDGALGRLRGGNGASGGLLIQPGEAVKVLLRPDDVLLDVENGSPAVVEQRSFRGPTTLYSLRLASGESVMSVWPSHLSYGPGDTVSVGVQARKLIMFPALESRPISASLV